MNSSISPSISIKSKGDYLIFKVPKSLISLGNMLKKKVQLEDQLLALFTQGHTDYKDNRLKAISSLADLTK